MAQTWFFRAFVCLKDSQTFSNLLDVRKQELETSLAGWDCISDFMGMCKHYSTWESSWDPRFELRVSGGLCVRLDPHSAGIVETCVTGKTRYLFWQNRESGLSGEARPRQGLHVSPHNQDISWKNLAGSARFGQKKAGRLSRIEYEQFWTHGVGL